MPPAAYTPLTPGMAPSMRSILSVSSPAAAGAVPAPMVRSTRNFFLSISGAGSEGIMPAASIDAASTTDVEMTNETP